MICPSGKSSLTIIAAKSASSTVFAPMAAHDGMEAFAQRINTQRTAATTTYRAIADSG